MNINCIVDVASREVSFQDTYRIASYDHNVDVIHFSVEPIEDFSLDLSSIKIAAQGPNKARHDYSVDPSTVAIEEETGYITFDWPIPAGVTEMPLDVFKYGDKGQLIFAVCAEIISGSTVSKAWHSDDGIITVVAHLEPESGGGEDPEEEATNAQKIAALQASTSILQRKVAGIAGGIPPTADSTAEMDPADSNVYINTTDSKWYYWDGSDWQIGGTYGGTATDTTLTEQGVAADSEATGNAINQVTERVSIVEDNLENATITYDEFVQGRRAPNNAGVIISDSSRCTCKSLITVKAGRTLSIDGITSGYKYVVAYGSYDSGWLTGSYSLTASEDITILINVAPVSGNTITPASFELAAVVSTMLSEMKDAVEELSTAGVAPIAITGEWVLGEIKSSGANGSSDKRIRLNDYTLFVKAGTYITCSNPDYQFGVAEYAGQTAGTFILLSAWANEYTVQNDSYIRIVMRYADNSLTSSADLETMPPTMHAYPSEGSIAYKFDSMYARIVAFESIKEQFAGSFSALWEIGSIRETGSNASSATRIRTKDYIPATAGNVIKTTNSLYKLSVHEYSSEDATAQTSTSDFDTEYEIQNDGYIRIVMAYTDDRTVTSDDLTALPSALIVYKADSLTAEIEEIKDKIASGGSDIADYYAEEMADTIDKVGKLQTEPALTFMTVTDIHRYVAGVQNFQNTIRNMRYFSEKVGCDFVLNLGDNVEGNTAPDVTYGYCRDMLADFNSIGISYVSTLGNHDTNPYYQSGNVRYPFDMGQCYGAYYPLTRASKINVSENGTDYYIDFDALDIRLISINGNNVNAGRSTYTFGVTSADFLTSALNTDRAVIFVTHVSPVRDHVFDRQDVGYNSAITSALTAFVEGGGKLLGLSGHSHVDMAFISPWVEVMDTCNKFEQADLTLAGYQAISGYIDAISNPARTAQTATEDAWSVNIYKPISNTLHQIRFGAGSDRHFHLTPIAPSTVTSMLDNVTWSSSDTSVATVSGGVITEVGTGRCAVIAKDSTGNIEVWIVEVSA